MRLPGFVGGSNVLSSTLEDCELSVNEFPEVKVGGHPKVDDGSMRDRPGLGFMFSAGSEPVESGFYLDGRAFFVSGTSFCEQFDNDTFVVRGTVANDGIDLATMCSNGSAGDQVFIVSGSAGYIFTLSTNAFAEITDPAFPANPVMCEFFAGYFFVLLRNSRAIQWSALEDGTTWDLLDVFERSWAPDNINFIKRNGTHIWCVGTQTSEVLYATGGIEVFAPAQESLIEHGSIARFAGQLMPEGVTTLDQDARGGAQVITFNGLTPNAISTYSINLEQASQAGILNASYAFVVQMEGHVWYVLNNRNPVNTFRLTPVYDATEGLWHHWAHWDPSSDVVRWIPFRGFCHWFAFERHFIGDRLTGAVYELSFDILTDQLAAVA